jgi:hypothetical protein
LVRTRRYKIDMKPKNKSTLPKIFKRSEDDENSQDL